MKNPFKIQLKYLWVLLFLLALGVYIYLNSYQYLVIKGECYRVNKWSGKLETRLTGRPPMEIWINANEWFFIDKDCEEKVKKEISPKYTFEEFMEKQREARLEELKKRGYL